MEPMLFTIGYEKATLPDVIEKLQSAGIKLVIDVRAVAASRRAGFSKTILRNTLEEAGIDYEHLRGLGTPKEGREAARKGRIAEMGAIFSDHMDTPEAQDGLANAIVISGEQPTALLCYEACAKECHRLIVADMIQAENGCEIVHL